MLSENPFNFDKVGVIVKVGYRSRAGLNRL